MKNLKEIFPMGRYFFSFQIFHEAGMEQISKKQFLITGYLEYLLDHYFPNDIKIITPRNVAERGSQLSLEFNCDLKEFHQKMEQKGVLVRFFHQLNTESQ